MYDYEYKREVVKYSKSLSDRGYVGTFIKILIKAEFL